MAQWGVTDPDLVSWVAPRLVDFPLRCQTERIDYDEATLCALSQTYVRHTDPPLASLDRSHERALRAGHNLVDLACGHDMMLARPDATTTVLTPVAGSE